MQRSMMVTLGFLAGLGVGLLGALLLTGGEDAGGILEEVSTDPVTKPRASANRITRQGESKPIRSYSYESSVQSFLDGTAVPEIESGGGKITGTITTEDGKPVSGCVVRALGNRSRPPSRTKWRKGDGPPEDPPLRQKIEEYLEAERWRRAARREGVSDETGAFVISGLTDNDYEVTAYSKGFEIKQPDGQRYFRVRPGQIIDFTAFAVVRIPVEMLLPDGTPPKNGRISWKAGRSTTSEGWYPELPEIRLAPGAFSLTAYSGKDDVYKSESLAVTVEDGKPHLPITFQLKGRTGIRGRIIFPRGHVQEHMELHALRYSGSSLPDLEALRNEGRRGWANAYDGFSFKFMDLGAGRYLIAAASRVGGILAKETVDVTEGMIIDQDLKVPEPTSENSLIVWVYGPGRKLLRNVHISVGDIMPWISSSRGAIVRKRGDGAFIVKAQKPGEGRRSGTQGNMLTVTSARYGRKIQIYPPASTSEITVTLDEPASLEVTVVGFVASEMQGRLELQVMSTAEARSQRRIYGIMEGEAGLSPEGIQTFAPLQPGSYEIQLSWKTERFRFSVIRTVDATLSPGKNMVSVTVPPLYTLTVFTHKDNRGQSVSLSRLLREREGPNFNQRKKTDKDGRAIFVALPAGKYSVTCRGPKGRQTMTVSIPGQAVVQFEGRDVTALRVTRHAAHGYLESVGILEGDLIVGAGGMSFDGSRPGDTILRGLLMLQEKIALDVLRGSKRLEITVDAAKFKEATSNARRLEAATR